jgi:hypothetical protein
MSLLDKDDIDKEYDDKIKEIENERKKALAKAEALSGVKEAIDNVIENDESMTIEKIVVPLGIDLKDLVDEMGLSNEEVADKLGIMMKKTAGKKANSQSKTAKVKSYLIPGAKEADDQIITTSNINVDPAFKAFNAALHNGKNKAFVEKYGRNGPVGIRFGASKLEVGEDKKPLAKEADTYLPELRKIIGTDAFQKAVEAEAKKLK